MLGWVLSGLSVLGFGFKEICPNLRGDKVAEISACLNTYNIFVLILGLIWLKPFMNMV